ncbi:hypothetical protein OF83DRAFT_1178329 [Amylostereum chailletii]|nr:hypothetical protein OF83DRAFT_1178329 [Amylostereum chailletii]
MLRVLALSAFLALNSHIILTTARPLSSPAAHPAALLNRAPAMPSNMPVFAPERNVSPELLARFIRNADFDNGGGPPSQGNEAVGSAQPGPPPAPQAEKGPEPGK